MNPLACPQHHPPIMGYKGLTIVLNKPSRFDLDAGRLLSGNAGNFFNNILSPLSRHNCDIRTVAAGQFTPLEGTKIILLLGQEALNTVRPGDLRTLRGSTFTKDNNLYISTFTPQDAYDRKNYEDPKSRDDKDDEGDGKDFQKTQRKNFKFWLYQDVKKTLRLLQFGPRVYPRVSYCLKRSAAEIESALLSKRDHNLIVDIETDKNLNITCFAFCFYRGNQLEAGQEVTVYSVPVKTYRGSFFYTPIENARIFRALCLAFLHNQVVGHNLAFDLFVLAAKYKVPFPRQAFCTMIGQHRLHMEVEKSLGHSVALYTDLPFHKDEGVFDPKTEGQEQQLWLYNAKDVVTTLFVYLGQRTKLIEARALEAAVESSRWLRPYLTMQYEGMRLDTARLEQMVAKFDRHYERLQHILSLLTGTELNPRSPKQVAGYLYDKLRLPEPEYDKTAEDVLHKLYIKSGAPSIRVILAMREIGTLRSKLTETLLWRNQRLTCAYKITGSDMHRRGSSALLSFKGSFKGYGTNCQNYSKKLRGIVIPDPGKTLFQIDQSGADAKIVAYLCVPDKFRSLFDVGIKPHAYVAMHIAPEFWAARLGIANLDDYLYAPIDKLRGLQYWNDLAKLIALSDDSPDPQFRYYYIGKQMCHSLNYDASWAMFQLIALKKSDGSLRLSNEACKKYHNLYRYQLFTELSTWHEEVKSVCQNNNRTVRNLFGYPRQFGGFWGDSLFKQLYAYIPQSTVACITAMAIREIQERIDSGEALFDGVSLLQDGHDSFLGQAPTEKIMDVVRACKPHMERDLTNFRGEKFKMGAGVAIGGRWSPKTEYEPEGLEEIKI